MSIAHEYESVMCNLNLSHSSAVAVIANRTVVLRSTQGSVSVGHKCLLVPVS